MFLLRGRSCRNFRGSVPEVDPGGADLANSASGRPMIRRRKRLGPLAWSRGGLQAAEMEEEYEDGCANGSIGPSGLVASFSTLDACQEEEGKEAYCRPNPSCR